jgi:hypothetical protein
VKAVIAVDPATGQIVETGHDSTGHSVVQVWTPTVPGSFVITDVEQEPNTGLEIIITLSRFGPNSYIFARNVVYPDGSMQVEALARQYRAH